MDPWAAGPTAASIAASLRREHRPLTISAAMGSGGRIDVRLHTKGNPVRFFVSISRAEPSLAGAEEDRGRDVRVLGVDLELVVQVDLLRLVPDDLDLGADLDF